MWWLHRYLAFDVPSQRRQFEEAGWVQPADEAATGDEAVAAASHRAEPAAAPDRTPRRMLRTTPQTLPILAIGDRIAAAYEVKQILNAGNMHTAYVAHHQHWNIDLIVKVPNPALLTVSGALQQIAARAERWSALGAHPHVASCYHLEWLDGVPLAIIEYVEGGNLRAWVDQGSSAELRVALDLAIQICHGLEHAHSRGVLHGRLTPENVLITPQGTPKLADFGTPPTGRGDRSLSGPLATGTLMRAVAYVAPERWVNTNSVDVQVDLFALGVCLYELFCGRPPYDSTDDRPQTPAQPTSVPGKSSPKRSGLFCSAASIGSTAGDPSALSKFGRPWAVSTNPCSARWVESSAVSSPKAKPISGMRKPSRISASAIIPRLTPRGMPHWQRTRRISLAHYRVTSSS
jgi:serine/threonine protein kinase